MFDYSIEICRIFKWAEKEMFDLKHPYVGTEHLLLSLLKNDLLISDLMKKYGVTYDSFKNELINVIGSSSKKSTYVLWTPLLKKVVSNANKNTKELTAKDLLISIIEEDEGIAIRLLLGMDIDLEKILLELKDDNNSLELLSFGKDLQDSVDMNEQVIGREKEIEQIIEVLIRKNKNNPLLIGESGVGKTAIVEELARRINNGNVPLSLKNKRIVILEMSSLVAGTKYRGEFEEKMQKIIKEIAYNQNIIIFIDEVHTIVNAGGAEGAISASDILKPYMARGNIRIIGATTPQEYAKYILKDKALTRRFEVIKVSEPKNEETIIILNKIKHTYEEHYHISITEDNIRTIVNSTDKYIKNRYNPDKSIAMLDLLCAKISIMDFEKENDKIVNELKQTIMKKRKMVEEENFNMAISLYNKEKKLKKKINNKNNTIINNDDIIRIIKEHCNLNKEISGNDLKELKKYLNSNLIGQSNAISKIIDLIKNKSDDKPVSIMLVGNTGVGKTLTVKLISEYLQLPLIKLDMSEYSNSSSIQRLIGANAGYIGYDDEAILDKVKIEPKTIILLDEIEKCHSSIMNLFLQILDEGIITNSKGEIIDFSHTIIFMTSNAKISKKIGFVHKVGNYDNYFSKEFVARLSAIIEYNPITIDIIKKYLEKKGIKDLNIVKNYDYDNLGLRGIDKLIHV